MLRSASDTGTRGPKGEIAFGLAATNQTHGCGLCDDCFKSQKEKCYARNTPKYRRTGRHVDGVWVRGETMTPKEKYHQKFLKSEFCFAVRNSILSRCEQYKHLA
jgi:hypothetical protein